MPKLAAPAQIDCTTVICSTVFLPVISVPAIAATLNDPVGSGQIDSIAPTLTWTPAITGTRYLIDISTTPDFAAGTLPFTTTKNLSAPTQEPQHTVPRNNLKGLTTYYWRVGVRLPEGISYSTTGQFTTAIDDPARYPPAPPLLDPPNNARLTTLTPALTWAAMPGVDSYRVKITNADGTTFRTSSLIEGTKTSYSPSDLQPRLVYYWQVKMHTAYGWSEYGPTPGWRFRTP
jgi:hypothetical protein